MDAGATSSGGIRPSLGAEQAPQPEMGPLADRTSRQVLTAGEIALILPRVLISRRTTASEGVRGPSAHSITCLMGLARTLLDHFRMSAGSVSSWRLLLS